MNYNPFKKSSCAVWRIFFAGLGACWLIGVLSVCSLANAEPDADALNFSECTDTFVDKVAPSFIGEKGQKLDIEVYRLCFDGFATLYSGVSRTPFWSAEHLTKQRIQQARVLARVDNFRAELRLPAMARAELNDYKSSGLDRGHIAPNGDMSTAAEQYASFSLANIAPQDREHNRNLWRYIESAVRDLALRYDEVYVVTGVAFLDNPVERLGGRVMVPSHFFKAVYVPNLQQAGVYFSPNDASGRYERISLQELSERIGIQVMPSLALNIQQTVYDLPEPMDDRQRQGWVLDGSYMSWQNLAVRMFRYLSDVFA